MVEAAFASSGLLLAWNALFAGACTAQGYGRPSRGRHVLQIEVDGSLYMDERLVRPKCNFGAFRN